MVWHDPQPNDVKNLEKRVNIFFSWTTFEKGVKYVSALSS